MQDNELENKTGFDAEWTAATASLPRAEAPQYFEANVRSRIEERKASGKSGSFAVLKLAIPAAALGALALFFVFSGYISNDIEPIAVVPETQNSGANQIAKVDPVTSLSTPAPSVADPFESVTQNSTTAAVKPNETNQKLKDGTSTGHPKNNGSSQVLAVNGAKPGVMPKGLNPNPQQNVTERGFDPRAAVRILEALRFAGVQGEIGLRGMSVTSVNDNSPAQRSGLRPGDIIEAINDTPVTATATVPGGTSLRTIRVIREGKRMTLSF